MNIKDKNVLVFGTGISGISAAKILHEKNANVILFDNNSDINNEDIILKLGFKDLKIITKDISNDLKIDLVVLSPGVPIDLPIIEDFKSKNIPIWGEIELAYNFAKGKLIAITGTNGKTTTTSLVGEIMKTYFEDVFVVGNIGIPYTQTALNTNDKSVTVAEISSFQLETIHEFKPDISAILNITPDHLNRHHTMENYIKAKEDITKNQDENNLCVLNYEDKVLRDFADNLNTKVIFFSSKRELDDGLYFDGENIIYSVSCQKVIICNISELNLLGIHNYENVMAAVAIALGMNVPLEYIKKAIINFKAVEHRIEYVTEKNKVKYYNDSKGTNPDAAIKGIQAMITPTILIAGGYDKQSEYDEWINSFDGKVKYLVLLGETKEKIQKTAIDCGFESKRIILVNSLKEAVKFCSSHADNGDSVLLSPACASWDMFDNYEQRGKMFKEYVNEL